MFRRYHYLDAHIHLGAKCFIAEYENKPIAFIAVLSFPHPIVRNFRRVHRLVVLPDYQGIGVGSKLLDFIGDYYLKKGYRYIITTSAPSLMNSLNRNPNWKLKNIGRNPPHTGRFPFMGSAKRITSGWEYKL